MDVSVSLSFYLVIGSAVSIAVWLADDRQSAGGRAFRVASAIVFWPFYLPILLRPRCLQPEIPDLVGPKPADQPNDELDAAIARVEHELDTALNSLDGWTGNVMAHQHDRFAELRAAWNLQANRIRELDRLLAQSDFVDSTSMEKGHSDGQPANIPRAKSDNFHQFELTRRQNIDRLCTIRRQMYDDLMGTLAWVRELVTMIHLAKYTGAPASRAEELVTQIAAAVEGLSEVTKWRKEPIPASCESDATLQSTRP